MWVRMWAHTLGQKSHIDQLSRLKNNSNRLLHRDVKHLIVRSLFGADLNFVLQAHPSVKSYTQS